jgi:hypothetical protein
MIFILLGIFKTYFQFDFYFFNPFRIFVYKMLLINELIYLISINTHFNHLRISSLEINDP